MNQILMTIASSAQGPPIVIDEGWGESDVMVYVLLGIGLILTVAVGAIFYFILARGDREE